MNIRFAESDDLDTISNLDKHLAKKELLSTINQKRVLVAEENGEFMGWLRFNLFWDNTPFMNMLFVIEPHREKGIGRQLVIRWESEMKSLGYKLLMTSTLANENSQHFYRKLNYKDAGSLLLPDEPLEIIFIKEV
jgi:N-acetylglutamate synthase-like GNAT family acetyltransferase